MTATFLRTCLSVVLALLMVPLVFEDVSRASVSSVDDREASTVHGAFCATNSAVSINWCGQMYGCSYVSEKDYRLGGLAGLTGGPCSPTVPGCGTKPVVGPPCSGGGY